MSNPMEKERTLLWAAGRELNAIAARDGAPEGVYEPYFQALVEAIRDALGGDIKPWPEEWMKPYLNEINNDAENMP